MYVRTLITSKTTGMKHKKTNMTVTGFTEGRKLSALKDGVLYFGLLTSTSSSLAVVAKALAMLKIPPWSVLQHSPGWQAGKWASGRAGRWATGPGKQASRQGGRQMQAGRRTGGQVGRQISILSLDGALISTGQGL